MAELGWMGIPFPEEVGGAGGTSLQYAIAVEELTRVDSSVAITLCAHTSLGTQPIYLFGSDEQKQEWLPRLCAGEMLGAFGLTEPEAGSDAGNTRTRAALDGRRVGDRRRQAVHHQRRHRHLRRRRASPPGPARTRSPTFVVANGTPGYEQGEPYRKMGWNASDTRPLTFTDCRVPEENLLGDRGEGFRQFLHVLDIGRIGVAAMGVGLAQGALDRRSPTPRSARRSASRSPSSRRSRPSSPTWRPRSRPPGCSPTRRRGSRTRASRSALTAAQAKLKTGRLAVRATEEAVQIHGGYGYIEEYPVCRFYRDAKILTIGEGTDEVQQMVIARALGA